MLLQKLFGRKKTQRTDPGIRWGRYSDNNKTPQKIKQWTEAEQLFKEEKFPESLDAFFEYLTDDQEENVIYERLGNSGSFQLFQGSKILRGSFDEKCLNAEIVVASMPEPSIPVMRRLLEMNFHLYYSRYSLHDGSIRMRFNSDISTANPNKLYYGLRELAIKADKQDDLLVTEFGSVLATDTEHIIPLSDEQKETRLKFFHSWLDKTLNYVETLDAEKFALGISFLLLNVVFRIDFLLAPEGKLMQEIEKIPERYYKKEGKPSAEKNQEMIDDLRKIRNKPKEEIFPYFFKSKHTFSIVSPQNHKQVAESINNALQNMYWYRDNNYPMIANEVMEYGLAYCQYSYSLPRPLTEFFQIFMIINHGEFFEAFGHLPLLYNQETNRFESELIIEAIEDINNRWRSRYEKMRLNPGDLNFSNLVKFNHSFLHSISALNFDT